MQDENNARKGKMASPNTLALQAEKNKVKSKAYYSWVSVTCDQNGKREGKGKTFKKETSVLLRDEL